MLLQQYNPFHNEWVSFIVAASPIVCMYLLLAIVRVKGYVAGVFTLIYTLMAALYWGLPLTQSLLAGVFGFSYGIFPIIYIIFPAFFLYNLVVGNGHLPRLSKKQAPRSIAACFSVRFASLCGQQLTWGASLRWLSLSISAA